jgi:hypothetical protein
MVYLYSTGKIWSTKGCTHEKPVLIVTLRKTEQGMKKWDNAKKKQVAND